MTDDVIALDVAHAGLAFICDLHGTIEQVLFDSLESVVISGSSRSLITLVDHASMQKAADFLAQVGDVGAVFDWELTLRRNGRNDLLRCTGIRLDKKLLVAGYIDETFDDMTQELQALNNEQLNVWRSLVKMLVRRQQSNGTVPELDDLLAARRELTQAQRTQIKLKTQLAWKDDEVERRSTELDILYLAARLAPSAETPGQLLALALDAVPTAERGFVLLRSADAALRIAAAKGYADTAALAAGAAADGSHWAPALYEGQTVLEDDLLRDKPAKTGALCEQMRHARSLLAIPLVFGGQVIGVLSLDAPETRAFSDAHVRVLEIMAAAAVCAVRAADASDCVSG